MGVMNQEGALYFATGIDNSGMQRDAEETTRIVGSITKSISSAGKIIGTVFGAATLAQFGREIINVRGEMQMLESSFETLLGGKAKADKMIADIKSYAIESPLSLTGVSEAAQTLLGFNVAAEDTIPIIKQIGDISMGNEERFKSLTLAFAQMSSTGKLMGQDLNQMINAGFNPLQEISAKTGKSISELKDDMGKGAVSAKMVEDAFRSTTAEGGKFYGMTQKQAEGIKGLRAQIDGAVQESFNNLGKSSEGFITGTYKTTLMLIENYEKIGRVLMSVATTYGVYRGAVMAVTVAERGWTIASMAQYKWLLLVEKAQKLLNATMLKNPYVAVATAIVGLVTVVIALHDRTTIAEKAQKKLNDTLKEAKDRKEALKIKGNELIDVLTSETASIYQQTKAYKELIALLPQLKGKTIAEIKTMDPKEIGKMLSEKSDQTELNTIQAQYDERIKNIEGYRKQIKKLTSEGADDATISYYRGQLGIAIDETKGLKSQLEEFAAIQKDAFYQENPDAKRKDLQSERIGLLQKEAELIERIKSAGNNDLASVNDRIVLKAVKRQIETNKVALESIGKVTSQSIDDQIELAKSKVSKLTSDLTNLRSGKTESKDYKKDIEETAKSLEEAQKTFELLTGASKKTTSDAQVDSTQDVNKILRDLELQNIKDTISIMEDGAEKQREQIKADYDARMSVLDEKEKELRDKQNGNLTKRQEDELEQSKQLTKLIKEKETAQVDKKGSDDSKENLEKLEKDWNEYYIAYGTYQEKRLAITEEYARQIAEAEGNVWKQQSLGKERDKALQDLDVSMAQQSDLWIRLFSDAEKLTTSSLQKIIQETQNLLDYLNGAEGAEIPIGFSPEQLESLKKDPEKVKSILDGMQQKIDYMNKRNPFGSIIQGFKDLKKAGSDTEKQMEATQKIIKGFGQVSDVVNQVGQAFTGISPDMDKVINGITTIVGDTVSMATTGAQLGGPIGAAIGGAIGLGTSLIKVFGGAKELSEKTIHSYETYIGTLDDLIAKQKELIQSTSGSQAVIEAEKAKKLIEAQVKASRDLGKEYLNSGAGAFSSSHGVKMKKEIDPFRKELKNIGIDLDSLGGRVTGLFDLTADQLLRIKQEVPKLWAKLDDSTRQYLEAIIAGDEKLQDLIKTTQEAVAGLTFDEAKDSLKALMLDADSTFENISGKFDDYMRNSIMNLVMDGSMKQKLKAWYENYVKALSDGSLTESEVDKLRNEYGSIVSDAMKERDDMFKAAGIDPNKQKTGVTGELKAEMTEGTGSQLVGLWNMTALDIRAIKDYITQYGFNDISKELSNLLNELNDIRVNTGNTADNTAYTEEGFKKLEEKLDKIEKNTKQNNSRG